jgi:hypothetical protein
MDNIYKEQAEKLYDKMSRKLSYLYLTHAELKEYVLEEAEEISPLLADEVRKL